MKYLVMTMRKPHFDDRYVLAHYEFLQDLRARGILEQSGPFTDKSGGAYVIGAENIEQARQISERDPLHLNDCSEIIVREWNAN